MFWEPHPLNPLLPGGTFAGWGPAGQGNVTEGRGAEKHHTKDAEMQRMCQGTEKTATLTQETDLTIQLQAESYQ